MDPASEFRVSLAERIESIHQESRRKEKRISNMRVHFNNAITFYDMHGIFFLPYDMYRDMCTEFHFDLLNTFKKIAKGDERVFIMAMADAYAMEGGYAAHTYGRSVTSLVLPKRKAVRQLVAPLLSAAHETGDVRGDVRPLSLSPAPGIWRFHFRGTEGIELMEEFFKSCRTHPTNRLILKLYDGRR